MHSPTGASRSDPAIADDPVNGVWGSLSIVTGNDTTNITTQPQVWDRDADGKQITNDPNKPPIEGATAIELTSGQLTQAVNHNLWIQGGTQSDPVLNTTYPGGYAFGALRCATDNVNGDNVEYIQFAGRRHVYCFAYYVKPPPPSGTIIIRKALAAGTPKLTQSFTFRGNISYTPGRDFSLKVEQRRRRLDDVLPRRQPLRRPLHVLDRRRGCARRAGG